MDGLRRVLEIALADSLNLDNGVPRNRTLIAIALAGLKSLEVGDLADRLAVVESILKRQGQVPPTFTEGTQQEHDDHESR